MTLKRLWDEVKRTRIKVRINKCRKRDIFCHKAYPRYILLLIRTKKLKRSHNEK